MSKYKRSGRPQSSPSKRTTRPRPEALESRLVLSTISGTVFNELHDTGVIAEGDPGLAGRTVFVDLQHDKSNDPGDPSAVTDASGHYVITGVNPGATLQVVTYPGDNPTTPTSVVINSNSSTVDFGLQPQSTVFPTVPSLDSFAGGFVQSLYRNILGRDGDTAGVAFWDAKIKAGATNAQVAGQFYQSQECLTNVVKSYYTTYLGHAGDPAGIAFWVGALGAGASHQEVAAGFLSSTEYQRQARHRRRLRGIALREHPRPHRQSGGDRPLDQEHRGRDEPGRGRGRFHRLARVFPEGGLRRLHRLPRARR